MIPLEVNYERRKNQEIKENSELFVMNNTPADKIISILFDCKITSVIECSETGEKSLTKTNEKILSIPIPNKDVITLDDCINEFSKKELLDECEIKVFGDISTSGDIYDPKSMHDGYVEDRKRDRLMREEQEKNKDQ